MEIEIQKIPDSELKLLVTDNSKLGFGTVYTDYMFTMEWSKGAGWHNAQLSKYGTIPFDPASVIIQYAQQVFEGMKAFCSKDGEILLFRPDENAKRMYSSAQRLCMEPVETEDFLQAVKAVVNIDKRWLPKGVGTSLYIRPTLIGDGVKLGVHPSDRYLFCVLMTAVGPYFANGFNPISLYVEDKYVRACVGGVGDAKTSGNYAASLLAGAKAETMGYSQVLWLDAATKKHVEEAGSMNIFFVYGNKVVTPRLTGSILPGITRKSVLALAPTMGFEAEERDLSIDDVIRDIENGSLTEAFGTGTAAVIAPVGSLFYKGKSYAIGKGADQVGSVTTKLYEKLVSIQYGESDDPFHWVCKAGKI